MLLVYAVPNGLAWSRLAISVSKRLGPAVKRNRIRRRLRETFRREKANLPKGLDLVCVAREGMSRRDADIATSLQRLTARLAARFAREAAERRLPDMDS